MSLPLSAFIRVKMPKSPAALQTQDQSVHLVLTDEYPDNNPVLRDNAYMFATRLSDVENVWGSDAEITKACEVAFAPDEYPTIMVGYWNKLPKQLVALANSIKAVLPAKQFSQLDKSYTFSIKSREFNRKEFTVEITEEITNADEFVVALNTAIESTPFTFTQSGDIYSLSAKEAKKDLTTEAIELGGTLADDLRLLPKYGMKEVRGRDAETLPPETLVEAISKIENLNSSFFGCYIACDLQADDDLEDAHDYLLASEVRHVLAATVRADYMIFDRDTTNVIYRIAQKNSGIFSATISKNTNKHIGLGYLVLAGSTNWSGVGTAKNMKFKMIEGVSLDDGISPQIQKAADEIGLNYYAGYANDAMVFLAQGRQVALELIHTDSVVGRMALANQIESNVATTLAGARTKIAQTDEDQVILELAAQEACTQFRVNGFLGDGLRWNSKGFGTLKKGDIMPIGFYIFSMPYHTQSQADREAGKAMPIQIAAKESGAVGDVDINLYVER